MSELQRLISRRIRASGPITIADYMAEALFHPGYGYYVTRDPLGARGDFITAPEISQVFGELIGLWCADLWARMGKPDPVILAELGPGRGTLMADALRALNKVAPDFRRALRLHLVEISPVLRQAQAAALAEAKPQWHDNIASLPPGKLILVANEFLDALPVRQLMRGPDGWHERKVDLTEDGAALRFVLERKPDPALAPLVPQGLVAKPGNMVEVSLPARAVAQSLGARLKAGGAALFIDYGYYPSACGNTLQALRQHRRQEILAEPGEADLTAHVDFAAVAQAAIAGGARVWGPVDQGAFLGALGIVERAKALLKSAKPEQTQAIDSGIRRLVDPKQMGSLFKAVALTDPTLEAPAGFTKEIAA